MSDQPVPGTKVHGRTRRRTAVAVSVGALACTGVLVAVVGVIVAGVGFGGAVDAFVVTNAAMGLAFPAAGVVLATHRPRNPIGWLLLADGLGHAMSAAAAALVPGVLGPGALGAGWPEPILRLITTVFVYSWPWSIALFLPLALLLFPDGHLPTRRWRWWAWLTVLTAPLFVVESGSEVTAPSATVTAYLSVGDYAGFAPLWTVSEILRVVITAGTLVALVVRYRRGDERQRRQLLWLALAVGLVVVVLVIWGVFARGSALILLALPLVPIAMTVAVLRHQLLDIRLVVSRTLLYVLLSLGVVGVYLGLVAASDVVLRREVGLETSVLATIVVAVAFNPVRVRLQRIVDRLLYGDRADPLAAAWRVGARLATAGPGLGGVPEAVCDALRLPFAAVRSDGVEVAAHGTAPSMLHTIHLKYAGSRAGELVVGARAGQQGLDPRDRSVLELLAVPVAVAVHATALSQTLQRSREGLVAAGEEERRRLRRDLHDGLGPTLTGVAFQADAARNLMARDPDRAADLLDALRAETTTAISEIRRLVEGLRPPALDELGLVEALRREAARLTPLDVRVTAEPLPNLPAAVEVAAYRIASESLNNVARHARATSVRLVLRCTDRLEIDVTDDGPRDDLSDDLSDDGPAAWLPGVGLASMAERAAELGGSCVVGPVPGGGGRVHAALPLAAPALSARNGAVGAPR